MRALGPDVRYANDHVGRDLALYVEIPGLDVCGSAAAARHEDYPAVAILTLGCKGTERRKYVWHAFINLERNDSRGACV